jgi:hypothetical protein
MASTESIPGGMRIQLDERTDMNAAMAHMRCHVAFAQARDHAGVESCPLYVPEIRVERVGSTQAVDLTTSRPGAVEDLRRRVEQHDAPQPDVY